MNYKLLVDTAMLAGEIMLVGGAETFRVEDTMSRILQTSGLEKTETFVTPTGIFLTLGDTSIDNITLIKRIDTRITNLSNIYEVNNISRALCNNTISLNEAYEKLKFIKQTKKYNITIYNMCLILGSASFTVLLGGKWIDCFIASINGGLVALIFMLTQTTKIKSFIKSMICSIAIAFTSAAITHFFDIGIQRDILISGSAMPLLPGVAITNAIRDILQGDYLSGGARAIEAFVSAATIAAGIGVGLALFFLLIGGGLL